MKNKPVTISPKRRLYWSMCITLITTVMLSVFFIIPSVRETKKAYALFVEKKVEIDNLIQSGSTASVLQRQLAAHENKLTVLREGLIAEGRELDFLQFLEDLGKTNGLEQTIELTEKEQVLKDSQNFARSGVALQAKGTFSRIAQYLLAIESAPYYININSMNITGAVERELASARYINIAPIYAEDNSATQVMTAFAPEEGEGILFLGIAAEIFWQ